MHLKGHSWILRLIESINQILQSLQARISAWNYLFKNSQLLQIIIIIIIKSISLTISEICSLQAKINVKFNLILSITTEEYKKKYHLPHVSGIPAAF